MKVHKYVIQNLERIQSIVRKRNIKFKNVKLRQIFLKFFNLEFLENQENNLITLSGLFDFWHIFNKKYALQKGSNNQKFVS